MTDKEFLQNLGKKVAFHRKDKGLSQNDLCAMINMEKPNLSAIENGRQNVTSLTLKKIADSLDIEVFLFFSRDLENKI